MLHGGEPLPPMVDYRQEPVPGVNHSEQARDLSAWHRMNLLRQKRRASGLAD